MSKKLFDKLNSQITINELKSKPITEEEAKETECKIVFEDAIETLSESVSIKGEDDEQ